MEYLTVTRGRAALTSRRGETAVVFQAPTLMPWASAEANVALPLKLAGLAAAEARAKARQALAEVRLTGAERAKPAQLSGGMAMRVSLARALARHRRLALTVKVILVPAHGSPVTVTRPVVLHS